MKVAIGIPFRDTPGRAVILEHLLRYLTQHHPDWPVTLGDSGHNPFNRAATRNHLATTLNADVIVISDADTFVHPHHLRAAVSAARDGGLHYPFTWAQNHTPADIIPELMQLHFPERGGYRATGGIYVVRPDVWESFGGQDENFTGWGGEDDATFIAASTLARVHRQRGIAVAIEHEAIRKAADPTWDQAAQRMNVYRALRRNPTLMREFIQSREDITPWLKFTSP